jgi:hypothetical protein
MAEGYSDATIVGPRLMKQLRTAIDDATAGTGAGG